MVSSPVCGYSGWSRGGAILWGSSKFSWEFSQEVGAALSKVVIVGQDQFSSAQATSASFLMVPGDNMTHRNQARPQLC